MAEIKRRQRLSFSKLHSIHITFGFIDEGYPTLPLYKQDGVVLAKAANLIMPAEDDIIIKTEVPSCIVGHFNMIHTFDNLNIKYVQYLNLSALCPHQSKGASRHQTMAASSTISWQISGKVSASGRHGPGAIWKASPLMKNIEILAHLLRTRDCGLPSATSSFASEPMSHLTEL